MAQVSVAQDGIQKLLAAEQEAQQIIAKARKAKSDRLKQAKAEADKEIQAYKQDKENSFQQKVSANSSNAGDTTKRLADESAKEEEDMKKAVQQNKQKVLDTILGYVTTVKLPKE